MSTDASDSRGSHCSGAPSAIEKKIVAKPPFNLYFSKCQPPGRSDFRVSKLDAKFITPKFYSRGTDNEEQIHQNVEEIVEKSKFNDEGKNRRDRNCLPLLSSQSYGWWHDRNLNTTDHRFNFHKSTSDMVHSNIMIQCEDKKIRGFCN